MGSNEHTTAAMAYNDDTPAGPAKALWGGRFAQGMSPEMVPLNLSLDIDRRLWREDIQGSRAWARAIARAGVLSAEERDTILEGLDSVEVAIQEGALTGASDEDIHSAVERLLQGHVGVVAGKLHTGRSRNDQSATDVRLWGMASIDRVRAFVVELLDALHTLAVTGVDPIMPGYTHLQQGQPIRAAHWTLAHFWAFARDLERLEAARSSAAVLPLGSGAIAGCPFPVDRDALCVELGFDRVSENSVDTVSDRDWICDVAYAGAMLGVHLSRLGEDLVLFSSMEFGFVRLSDGFSTGSSLMPQKRNPDAAELARGKAGRLVGNLQALLVLLKGLPTGYNRDLQEDKEQLFDTVDTLLLTLPAVAGMVRAVTFRPERMAAAMDSQLLATDLADYLVRRGVPFRESHEVIGRLVRRAEERGVPLSDLSVDEFQGEHAEFAPDVHTVFDWSASVDSRDSDGGTSRRAVVKQLDDARAVVADARALRSAG